MKPTGFICAVFSAFLSATAASATSFQTATTTSIAPYLPSAAAVADFNGDGTMDLALAISNGSSHALRILNGNGDGTLAFATDLATTAAPGGLLAADLNGDGIADLAVTNTASNIISIFLCNGDGTFQARTDYATGTGPTAIAGGDFRGDGVKDDLAVINGSANSIAIFLNDGNGTLTATGSGTWPTAPDSLAGLAVGDFNGDAIDDLAASRNTADTVQLFFGSDIGTFASGSGIAVGTGPSALAATDLNHDGVSDLVVVNSGSATVSVITGSRGGSPMVSATYPVTTPADSGANPRAISLADFNRDGILDIAVANNVSNTLSVLGGRGNATFAAAEPFADGGAPSALAWGDLDGSGNELISTSTTNATYSVLLNNSPPAAGLSVLPGSHDYGKFQIGHYAYLGKLLTLTNNGSDTLTISSATTSGANSADFQATTRDSASCGSTTPTITPGNSCTILAEFLNPITEGSKSATLNLTSNATLVPTLTVPLAGTGIQSTTPYTVRISFLGMGSGTASFSSGDTSCSSDCSRTPAATPTIFLTPTPGPGAYLHGWRGCDRVYNGSCLIDFSFTTYYDRTLTINFGKVTGRIMVGTFPIYAGNLYDAYNSAGDTDTIKLPAGRIDESLTMDRNIQVVLSGGYDSGFATQGSPSVLRGVAIAQGSAVMDNIVLQ
jgi:hypothetical protein